MRFFHVFLFLFFSCSCVVFAQTAPPKREFRAVWIASVANIDWPSQKGLSSVVQQQEFTYILDEQRKNGMNAVIVQVRPSTDALYRSKYELWSEWLTGKQGREPNPPYDPLTFQITEAHARNLEFHAWFNPYRAVFDSTTRVAPNHITNQRPEWFISYQGKKLFDPGLPEVRQYITSIIMDVVRRYDVDGVHFDDYFYPYPAANKPFPDSASFRIYGQGFTNLADWRRSNIDLLIKTVADSIQAAKPYVKFGISPFGVWKNQSEDPLGSATRAGVPSYSTQYANVRKWLQLGWIDYVVPQIYWHIGHPAANYQTLTEWWNRNVFGRHLYIGQGPYKINHDTYPEWNTATEIPRQLRLNRGLNEVKGSVFFSSKSVMANPNNVQDSLRQHFYPYPALVPVMPWKKANTPLPPSGLTAAASPEGVKLTWQYTPAGSDPEAQTYYVLYRFDGNENIDLNNPQHILTLLPAGTTRYTDPTSKASISYKYALTAVNRLHTESAPVITESVVTATEKAPAITRSKPKRKFLFFKRQVK